MPSDKSRIELIGHESLRHSKRYRLTTQIDPAIVSFHSTLKQYLDTESVMLAKFYINSSLTCNSSYLFPKKDVMLPCPSFPLTLLVLPVDLSVDDGVLSF